MIPLVQSGDGVVLFDAGMRVLAWSGAAERITGRASQDAVGHLCWDVIGGLDEEGGRFCSPDCSIARACREGRPAATVSLFLRTRAGRRRHSLSTLSVACGPDKVFLHVLTPQEPGAPEGRGAALTPRQLEVLELLAQGLSTAAIAARLTLSQATVRNHVRAVLAELGAHSRLEAVMRACRLGLV